MSTSVKPEATECPICGKPLPAGVLSGFCPACLLAQGADTERVGPPDGVKFQPPPLDDVAKLFPQLEILGLLGAGGMGAVYKARQPALDRIVALKVLPAGESSGPNFTERFNREARALARLSHQNIVAVYEFGQIGELSFFMMEFVDGANLRQLEKASRLSPREALQIIPQICDALQYAHDQGVVHRDIKPENVLLDRKGRVKIADFGLAKILGYDPETARLTAEGQVMGTPHYMAPEQVERPLTVDHRADIYSLGVVFYEMLTGDLPLGKFSPPSRKVQVDVRLDDVVLRALENDPARRYQKASEVKSQVETISGTPEQPTGPIAPPAPEPHFKRWLGFALVTESAGKRTVNRKGTLKAFGIVFGLLTLAFAGVSLILGHSLLGWVGIAGSTSLQMRLWIAAVVIGYGVWRTLRLPQTSEGTAKGRTQPPWVARHWKPLLGIYLLIVGGFWFHRHWLSPYLKANFGSGSMRPSQIAWVASTPGGLAANLPEGGSVELIGLADLGSAPDDWWSPNGTPLEKVSYEIRAPDPSPIDGQVWKNILFRWHGFYRYPAGSMIYFKPPIAAMRSDLEALDQGQPLGGGWPWRAAFPEAALKTTISVGFKVGAWRTFSTLDPSTHMSTNHREPKDPNWRAVLHQVMDNGGNAQVTLMCEGLSPSWTLRTIAIDRNGVEHTEGSGASNNRGIAVAPNENMFTWTYTFRGLPLASVAEFRVQAQPVHWIEFRDVALQSKGPPRPKNASIPDPSQTNRVFSTTAAGTAPFPYQWNLKPK